MLWSTSPVFDRIEIESDLANLDLIESDSDCARHLKIRADPRLFARALL